MKILTILPNDSLGGAEQYLKMLVKYYANKGHEIDVCFLSKKKTGGWQDIAINKNIKLIYSKKDNFFFSVLYCIRYYVLLRKKYNLILTSHVKITGLVGVLLKIKVLKADKFIARESTSVFKRFNGIKLLLYKSIYVLGYSKVDLLICQTYFMKKQLLAALPWLSKITLVIPNPIDLNVVEQQCNGDVSKELLSGEYIVSAGRLIPEKGFDILLKAFMCLSKSNKKLKLIILGEGDERQNLERDIEKLNLKNKVILKGFVSNVYPYFKHAKACVVSSRIEGFPNVLLQMMSQNTSVVSTLCAGGVKDIKGIIICDTHSVNKLAIALELVLNQNANENRAFFNQELEKRDINNFAKKIVKAINHQ